MPMDDPDNLPHGLLVGIKCRCSRGHEWDCACATIWTQPPYCEVCWEHEHVIVYPKGWRGLWTSEVAEFKDCHEAIETIKRGANWGWRFASTKT